MPKQLKKPSGKRPAMFYQKGDNGYTAIDGDRIRIIHPNGKSEWMSFQDSSSSQVFVFDAEPCWSYAEKSFKEAVKAANEFDRHEGFEPMEFVCEL